MCGSLFEGSFFFLFFSHFVVTKILWDTLGTEIRNLLKITAWAGVLTFTTLLSDLEEQSPTQTACTGMVKHKRHLGPGVCVSDCSGTSLGMNLTSPQAHCIWDNIPPGAMQEGERRKTKQVREAVSGTGLLLQLHVHSHHLAISDQKEESTATKNLSDSPPSYSSSAISLITGPTEEEF